MKLDIQLKSKEVGTEDLRTHKIRQEEKERAIYRAKIYMLIGVAILCHVWDRVLTVDELRNVQIKAAAISEETEEVGVDSRIMPVLKEEARNIGFMHRKRFFSPEIKLDHSITHDKFYNESTDYINSRDCSLDKVRDDNELLYEGGLLKYKKEYFNTLLNMFPSLGECVSILSDDLDSFYTFINSANVKEHKYKILASLLMLAEGKRVPLSFNKSYNRTELVLRKTNSEEEHFRLNMNVLVKTSKEGTESTDVFEEVLQEKAIEVINFFIENRENKVFIEEKDSSEPSDCDMHEKAQFVNSPAFLIQTYIHYCLETTKEAVLFIHTAYCLLGEWMLQKEESLRKEKMENIARYLISRYIEQEGERRAERDNAFFKSIVSEENRPFDIEKIDITHMKKKPLQDDYICLLGDLLYVGVASDVVPVPMKTNNLSSSSPALGINSLDDKHIQEDAKPALSSGFTDPAETVLLAILMSIAYDAKNNIYRVDHIESASEELKSFFKKYSSVRERVGKEMHNDWNKVVGGLPNPKIRYMRPDRNQLALGMINMLYVIKEITGFSDTKNLKIDRLRDLMDAINNDEIIISNCNKVTDMDEFSEKANIKMDLIDMFNKKIQRMQTFLKEKQKVLEKKQIVLKEKELFKEKNPEIEERLAMVEAEIEELQKENDQRNQGSILDFTSEYRTRCESRKKCLEDDVFEYLNEIIKRFSFNNNIKLCLSKHKWVTNEKYSDLEERIEIEYKLNEHLEDEYHYSVSISIGIGSELGKDHIELNKTKQDIYESTESPIIGMLSSYTDKGIKTSEPKEENRNPSTLNKHVGPTFLYGKEHRVVDILLLNPPIHNMDHINQNVWLLLLYGMEKKLDKNHPFLRLADNILGSACFMDSEIRNTMFIFLSHIPVDKHYPLTGIDKSIDEKYIPSTIRDVLYLAQITKFVSQTTYANILTDLMISLQRKCSNDNYKSNDLPEDQVSIILSEPLLIEILTLNGTTMDYITKIIQSMEGVETKYTASDCKRFGNRPLMWIICSAQTFKYTRWSNIAQECYNLIDIEIATDDGAYMYYCSDKWTGKIKNVLKEIEDLVCVKKDRESMERFSKIRRYFPYAFW
ncbi:uncharacterized protein NESG_00486 [Nematocida ausubeli]|uniref:Uncharacterized protein n=1 Tax=Nematocida ausubeli (strain ATCC PRA-371 / ERTm2) TaxID=1913371 RepID=A0A086J5J0_NEMA1|nr:uncharacterized protein NESG_00486 [Nematocida ausubeli]KFG27408.1 hypothetical protein NESG_00486 [Nematocida ausubeli]